MNDELNTSFERVMWLHKMNRFNSVCFPFRPLLLKDGYHWGSSFIFLCLVLWGKYEERAISSFSPLSLNKTYPISLTFSCSRFILMYSIVLCSHHNSALTTTVIGAIKVGWFCLFFRIFYRKQITNKAECSPIIWLHNLTVEVADHDTVVADFLLDKKQIFL